MSQDKNKQIAATVVLAQHGNKEACREIYLQYYRQIYFMCLELSENPSGASDLAADVFIKMFETIDKLGDHMAFEQWLYAIAVTDCGKHMNYEREYNSSLSSEICSLVLNAKEFAKTRDHFNFERSVVKIIHELISDFTADDRKIFYYCCFGGVSEDKTAAMEKMTVEDVSARLQFINSEIQRKTKEIESLGLDISAFTGDIKKTLMHIASKAFVPDDVYEKVSGKIGVNVNPFADNQVKDKSKEKKSTISESKNTETKPVEKKFSITKSDIILFFSVLAVALIIFGSVRAYMTRDKSDTTVPMTESTTAAIHPVRLWNGSAASGFEGGIGTEDSPYVIATGGQLAYLANLINEGNSKYNTSSYILAADILLNDTENYASWKDSEPSNTWTPIGYSKSDTDHSYFMGTFDGDGHKIMGMYISSGSQNQGLFGVIRGGSVENLIVSKAYVKGGSNSGGIAGYFSTDEVAASGFSHCGFYGTVECSGSNAGGIVGYIGTDNKGADVLTEYCCSFGSVNAVKSAGGIVGLNETKQGSGTVINCVNNAVVSASESDAGGISGFVAALDGNSSVSFCINIGIITSKGNSGALVGNNTGDKSEISDCVYFDKSSDKASGGTDIDNNTVALSADKIVDVNNYKGFDFQEIWTYVIGENGYPIPVGFSALTEDLSE